MIKHSSSQSFVGLIPAPDLTDIEENSTESSTSCPSTPITVSSDFIKHKLESEQAKFSPFPTVKPRELKEMIESPEKFGYLEVLILDARFDYEFRGGSIIGARNIRSISQIVGIFNRYRGKNICIVVHCEFSKNRGPTLIRLFREYDRKVNVYPALTFPNLFLLEGGYQKFYEECPEMCKGGYTPMRDEKYVQNGELRRSHSFFTHEMLQHKSSLRANRMQRCFSQSLGDWIANEDNASSLPSTPIVAQSPIGFTFSSSQ